MTSSGDMETEDAKPKKKVETFDDILPYVGEAGRYQWLLFVILLPFAFVYAFLYFTQFFLTLTPNQHWCTVPELDKSNLTDQQKIHLSIPIANGNELLADKSTPHSKCQMYNVNYTDLLNRNIKISDPSWPTMPCRDGWTFNYSTVPYISIAAELEWVCDRAYYSSVAQSVFFVGSIIGGFIFGYIADHYGRLPALIACNAVGFFGSIGTAFTNSFWTFCLCRLIVGTAFDNCFNILFIIVIEYVGPRYRTFMVNMSFGIYFAGSSCTLPWIAYYIANWRILSGVSAAPSIIAFATPWLVPESARWYISTGNIPKAIKMLKKFERVNGKTVKKEIYEEFEHSCHEMMKNDQSYNNYTVLDLFKKPRLAYITVMLIIYWHKTEFTAMINGHAFVLRFLVILVFDGQVWNMKLLDPDVFTSFSLAALTVLPASILLTLFLDKWGRRWMSFFSMMICGVFSFITLAMPPGSATVGMGIIARFGVTIAASIGFQYAAEILPTVVRAQGVSLIHIVGYLAHIIGPYVVYLATISSILPLVVLGLLALVVATQALFMPETLGQHLPQTLEEGNDFGREQSFWWVPCISSTFEKKKEFRKPLTLGSLQGINSVR